MKPCLHIIFAFLASSVALAANGHEFWLDAKPLGTPAGSMVRLTLNVGENFNGHLVGWAKPTVAALRVYGSGPSGDLRESLLTDAAVGGIDLRLNRGVTNLIAYDSEPDQITLGAETFYAYLRDEGLDAIIEQREATGLAAAPGRERFRRNAKALIGPSSDRAATFGVRTGQRLEIVPLANPLTLSAGGNLTFAVEFDGKPLSDALLKAWHHHAGQLVLIKSRTDTEGRVKLSLPYAGAWMVSVVHMLAATDTANVDWDSYWGNLTFTVPPTRRTTKLGGVAKR